MCINISGKGMEVSDYLKQTVEKKAKKFNRYFKPETDMQVTLSIEKSRHIAEVTVPFDGIVLRTEEVSGDMYSSIDAALKKLERQIRKHRTKLEKRLYENAFDIREPMYGEDVDDYLDEDIPRIVRAKKFSVKPMDLNEAILQMDILGHAFFVFVNAENDEVNVLYRRNDGNLTIMQPDYE